MMQYMLSILGSLVFSTLRACRQSANTVLALFGVRTRSQKNDDIYFVSCGEFL